jgi:hypothetical protein
MSCTQHICNHSEVLTGGTDAHVHIVTLDDRAIGPTCRIERSKNVAKTVTDVKWQPDSAYTASWTTAAGHYQVSTHRV